MFIAGAETDLDEMKRVGRVALWAAFGGVAFPMLGGAMVAGWFGYPILWQGIFIGTILTATSVSISAQTLIELGALKSKEGSTILGAAVIDDVMGIIVLSIVVALARAGGASDLGGIAFMMVRIALFFAGAILVGRALPTIARFADRLEVSQGLLAIVLAVAFAYAWGAEYLGGVAAITGSYLAGLIFAQTRYKKQIDEAIHPLTYSFFVPVFFISIGLQSPRGVRGHAHPCRHRDQGVRVRPLRPARRFRHEGVTSRRRRHDLSRRGRPHRRRLRARQRAHRS
jgi:Kef-type K+ transport system membrane component KefB